MRDPDMTTRLDVKGNAGLQLVTTRLLPDGARIAIARIVAPLPVGLVRELSCRIAGLDPWKRYGFTPDALARLVAPAEESAPRYMLLDDNQIAGLFVVRLGWMVGSYLNLIAILPAHQGRGIGGTVLDWLESEARARGERNQFVATSAFNTDALRLYQRHGFEVIAEMPGLISDAETELLLRKRMV